MHSSKQRAEDFSLGCRGKKHLCSSGLVCGCGSMRNGWACNRTAGNTYASEGMTQLLLALTLLSTPPTALPWNWTLMGDFSISWYSVLFSCCPFTTPEMSPHELMYAVLFQEQSTSLFPVSTCQGLLGGSACTNANVAHDQLLNTWAKNKQKPFRLNPNHHKWLSI